jgi:uncharacterized protein YbaP (TraB family)
MTYQEQIIALADSNDRQVQAIYALYLSGDLSAAEAAALMAAAIAQANSRAFALADLSWRRRSWSAPPPRFRS